MEGSSDNLIGGTGPDQGNVIANTGGLNEGIGIEVADGQHNQITHNSIFGNAGPGIYLDPGVGELVPTPTLTFTPDAGSTGTLSGTLKATPNAAYTIEIVSNPSAPLAGQEQGKTFIQDVTVDTDSSGMGTFSVTEPLDFYTATATDPLGEYLSVLERRRRAVARDHADGGLVVGEPVDGRPGGDVHRRRHGARVPGNADGDVTSPSTATRSPLSRSRLVGGVDQAQLTTSTLAAGSHTVSASYSGDANVGASSGSLPTETVTAPGLQTTTTTLASSLDPSMVGQPVTFTALVTAPSYQGTPTGTVTFTIDGQAQKPVSLSVVGGKDEALFVTSTLTAG